MGGFPASYRTASREGRALESIRLFNREDADMSTKTWTQYVAMDDTGPEPGRFQAALDSLEDWDDDFELGAEAHDLDPVEFEDPE